MNDVRKLDMVILASVKPLSIPGSRETRFTNTNISADTTSSAYFICNADVDEVLLPFSKVQRAFHRMGLMINQINLPKAQKVFPKGDPGGNDSLTIETKSRIE